jgi:hypothetical protein
VTFPSNCTSALNFQNFRRNQLLQKALECPRNYTYFIFMDGDAEIVEARDFGFNTGDPYRTFEGYLRRWQPAVSFPAPMLKSTVYTALIE